MFHRGGIINEKVVDVHQISHLHTEESRNKKKSYFIRKKARARLKVCSFFLTTGQWMCVIPSFNSLALSLSLSDV